MTWSKLRMLYLISGGLMTFISGYCDCCTQVILYCTSIKLRELVRNRILLKLEQISWDIFHLQVICNFCSVSNVFYPGFLLKMCFLVWAEGFREPNMSCNKASSSARELCYMQFQICIVSLKSNVDLKKRFILSDLEESLQRLFTTVFAGWVVLTW